MYRRTKKYEQLRERSRRMNAAKAVRRLARKAPEYPPELPDLRMRITIERFDFSNATHVVELRRTSRVDCFDAYVDGVLWRRRVGLSRVLEGVRKSLPRALSPRRFA